MKRIKICKKKITKLLRQSGTVCLALLLAFGAPVSALAEETIGEVTEETVETDVIETEGMESDATEQPEESEETAESETTEGDVTETDESRWVEQELLTLDAAGEFTVMFYYEGEQPEIIFISPDGKEYGEGISSEEEFLSAHGEGWSTYKVLNAEAGLWSVRCDKKNNEEIEYSMVDVVNSICVQSFTLESLEGTTATVRFEVTKGEEEVWYSYTISAVKKGDQSVKQQLVSGTANTSEPQELKVQLNISDNAECYLELEVVHSGNIETFDSMETGPFVYDNPNTVAGIQDFYVDVNLESGLCEVDWTSFRSNHWNTSYKLEVTGDGNTEDTVYNITTEETTASFYYPVDTESMEIALYVITDGILSEPKTKKVDFKNGEFVKVLTEEVTASATLELEYKTKQATELYVILNDKSGVYAVDGNDIVPFTMVNGWNTVEAYFTGDDGITYRAEKEVFYTWLAPEISLYEEWDGKTVHSDTVKISGNVKNTSTLTVNGAAVQPDEKGDFSYEMTLVEGENVIAIEAKSEAGIGASRTLTVTKGTAQTVTGNDEGGISLKKTDNENGLPEMAYVNLFPLIGMIVAGLILVLGFFLCTAKKKKGVAVVLAALFAVVTGAAVFLYFRLHGFNNSVDYVALAKSSTETAASYLDYEKYAKLTAIGAGGAFGVTLLGIVIGSLVKRMLAKKTKTEE